MQQRCSDRTTWEQFLQTFTSGMFQVKWASLLSAVPRAARSSPAEWPMVGNALHLAVRTLGASKALRTWSYSTSSIYLNCGIFSTLTHQAAVKKECWTKNTSKSSTPDRVQYCGGCTRPPLWQTYFTELNCSILKMIRFLPLKGCTC